MTVDLISSYDLTEFPVKFDHAASLSFDLRSGRGCGSILFLIDFYFSWRGEGKVVILSATYPCVYKKENWIGNRGGSEKEVDPIYCMEPMIN